MTFRNLAALLSATMVLAAAGCGTDTPEAIPTTTVGDMTTVVPGTTADPMSPAPTNGTAAPATTTYLAAPTATLAPVGTANEPLDLAWRANDPSMFVVERAGKVVAWRGKMAPLTVLDVTTLTVGQGEQGLLGLAFSHDGAHAYIDQTDTTGNTVIAEYAVGSDGMFDPASRRVLLTIEQPYPNHNGGNVAIGPDSMLYIGMGDGGAAGDPQRHGLDPTSLLGKILRIDPTPSASLPYSIPPDNPHASAADGARPEIWAIGVRNPWRFAFDSVTGDLWIGDVGQNLIEEIDVAWADPATHTGAGKGLNFGWSAFEAAAPFNADQPTGGVTMPVYQYPHGDAGCSVTGGDVYHGTAIPRLAGWYVFADYCSGTVSALRMNGQVLAEQVTLAHGVSVGAVRSGPDGELYVVSLGGDISRLVAA